jgi:5'-nucleotidase
MSARTILITNDDGIDSAGLHRLARLVRDAGHHPVVAAPWSESSGSSAGLTAVGEDGRVVTERRALPDLDGVPAYAVRALPGFIALLATRGAFDTKPDLVLSGINRGPNTGNAILHSGTVGAAFTACAHGTPAMAVSLNATEKTTDPHWDTAAAVAAAVLPWLADHPAPLVLNLNIPDVPLPEVRGLRRATLSTFGAVETTIAETGQGYVRVTMSEIESEYEPGTDAAYLSHRYATLTPLNPLCEAPDITFPDFALPGPDGA